jgi:hypothetical protein
MLIVLDDVLDEEHRLAVVGFFSQSDEARKMKWEPGGIEKLHGNNSPMAILLRKAADYFDLSLMAGSEYWAHHGTRPDWHIDKDEKLYEMSGNTECPICSIVYYADIDDTECPICSIVYYADIDVVGGNFVTETMSVTPVTNRMIAFSPGLMHGVEKYTGTRLSVAVNPWTHKPLGYV